MNKKDDYKTLSETSEGLYREKGSKFIAYAFPVLSLEDVEERLNSVRKLHPKSRHVCYAYKLGLDNDQYRANDDGEPSGSAGMPIYNQILSHQLTNTLVAVVRYFGGTKLGVSGLINAYKTSTLEAITCNKIVDKFVTCTFLISFDYSMMGDLLNQLKKLKIEIVSKDLNESPSLIVEFRESLATSKIKLLKTKILKLPLEMVSDETSIEGVKIEKLNAKSRNNGRNRNR